MAAIVVGRQQKTGSSEAAPVLKIGCNGRKDEVFILSSNISRLSQLMSLLKHF